MKKIYTVKGMSCQVCSLNVEKAAKKVSGVESAEVNLLENTLTVTGDNISDEVIFDAVKNAGYQAFSGFKKLESPERSMRMRLIASFVFLIPLMAVMIAHMAGIHIDPALYAVIQIILTAPIVLINRKYFIAGFPALIRRTPNMDSLIAVGSSAAIIYGIYVTVLIFISEPQAAHELSMNLYFESAAMILTLVTVGKYLETRSKGKTTEAVRKLLDLAPKTATVFRGEEITVAIEDVAIGDTVIVKPGGRIPVDGVVTFGSSSVDESALTGESIPVLKKIGDKVSAGTICTTGSLRFTAEKIGEETTLAKIIELVRSAAASKPPIARIADKVSGVFVPVVMLIALAAAVIWLLIGQSFSFALSIGISVLVISCPCALGLATPVAIMVGTGKAASLGILIKSSETLETTGRADTVIFDKTGTLTTGRPSVTDIFENKISKTELLSIAYSLENLSEHPLSKAVITYAKENGAELKQAEDFLSTAGRGISAKIEGEIYYSGNRAYMNDIGCSVSSFDIDTKSATPLYFAKGKTLIGVILVSDVIRDTSKAAVKSLKNHGLSVVMLTGDSKRAADSVKAELDLDEVRAELLPAEKELYVREKQNEGKRVIMVGDGINDAPSLARADVGIAIGAGSDIAIDAADIVLIKNNPADVANAVVLSRKTIRNIKENLFWALFYNCIAIPVAAGVLFVPFEITLSPGIAALAMSLSSVCVVTNALRLRFFKPVNSEVDMDSAPQINYMEKRIIKIEGMMCKHCKMAVENALKVIDGVTSVEVNLEEGTATVVLSKDVSSAVLSDAVTAADFKVVSVEKL
ncbi:MAG: heavy metal translocating P-type ATPase [Methanocorpusculum sp.]|nr:heavy metal translocating P-type ATPase [Methanocorpusculum sp.]